MNTIPKQTDPYTAIDSFLSVLANQVTAPADLTIYRLCDGRYVTDEPKLCEFDSVIHKGDLRQEAHRVKAVADTLLGNTRGDGQAQAAISHEIDAQLEAILGRGKRSLKRPVADIEPWSTQWTAKQRVEHRATMHAAAELLPHLQQLRKKARTEADGCSRFHVDCCSIEVLVPQRGEPLAQLQYLGSGAFKTVRKVQSLFAGTLGAQADGSNLTEEAKMVRRFAHFDGIVQPMIVADQSEDRYYMHFHGRTLCSILNEPIPPAKLVDAGLQLARGLRAIAAQGLVHDDFHDENILVDWRPDTQEISAVVADLGIMRTIGCAWSNNRTRLINHLKDWWNCSQPRQAENPFENPPRLGSWVKLVAFLEDTRRKL